MLYQMMNRASRVRVERPPRRVRLCGRIELSEKRPRCLSPMEWIASFHLVNDSAVKDCKLRSGRPELGEVVEIFEREGADRGVYVTLGDRLARHEMHGTVPAPA